MEADDCRYVSFRSRESKESFFGPDSRWLSTGYACSRGVARERSRFGDLWFVLEPSYARCEIFVLIHDSRTNDDAAGIVDGSRCHDLLVCLLENSKMKE